MPKYGWGRSRHTSFKDIKVIKFNNALKQELQKKLEFVEKFPYGSSCSSSHASDRSLTTLWSPPYTADHIIPAFPLGDDKHAHKHSSLAPSLLCTRFRLFVWMKSDVDQFLSQTETDVTCPRTLTATCCSSRTWVPNDIYHRPAGISLAAAIDIGRANKHWRRLNCVAPW